MHLRFAATLSLLACSALARADLDLRPKYENRPEGFLPRLYFTDGAERYGVGLDNETEPAEATADGVVFRFANLVQASTTLFPRHAPVPLPTAGDSAPPALTAAEKLLPPAAEGAALSDQGPDPLPINGWKSHRFVFDYRIGAVAYNDSITFITFPDGQQIVMQTSAHARDFARVAHRADAILRRWHKIAPGDNVSSP